MAAVEWGSGIAHTPYSCQPSKPILPCLVVDLPYATPHPERRKWFLYPRQLRYLIAEGLHPDQGQPGPEVDLTLVGLLGVEVKRSMVQGA